MKHDLIAKDFAFTPPGCGQHCLLAKGSYDEIKRMIGGNDGKA